MSDQPEVQENQLNDPSDPENGEQYEVPTKETILALMDGDLSEENYGAINLYYEEFVDPKDAELVAKLKEYVEKYNPNPLREVPEDAEGGAGDLKLEGAAASATSELERLRAENAGLKADQPSDEDKEELAALKAENEALRNQNKSDFGNDLDLSEKERAMLAPIKINCEKTGTHPLIAVESKLAYLKRRHGSLQEEATKAHKVDSGTEPPKVNTYLSDIKTLESIVNKAKKA